MNKCNIALFSCRSLIAIMLIIALVVCNAEAAEGYEVQPDGSVLYDNGNRVFGQATYTDWQGNKWLESDYDQATNGKYHIANNKIWFDEDSYLQISGGTLGYSYSFKFNEIKEIVDVKNKPLLTNFKFTHITSGINVTQKDNIFEYYDSKDGRYLAKTKPVWIEDATGNRTYPDLVQVAPTLLGLDINQTWLDNSVAPYVIDPSVEFNGSDNWAGLSGTMLEHGDGNLRAPPNVTTGLVSFWNPGTDVGSGNTLTDVWGSNDGTIIGATWNMTSSMLEYNGTSDYVNYGSDSSLDFTTLNQYSIVSNISLGGVTTASLVVGKRGYDSGLRQWYGADNIAFGVYNTSNIIIRATKTGIPSNEIHHFTATYNNKDIELFYDGTSVQTNTLVGTTKDLSSVDFTTGGLDNWFGGSIGTTYFYNTALTNDQINETRDNYHNNTSHMETDPIDATTGYVNMYARFNGTDVGTNTTIELQVKQNDTATWETAIADVTMNTQLTIPAGMLYQNASFRWYANTTYQPETDVIESVEFISGTPSFDINITYLNRDNTSYNMIFEASNISINEWGFNYSLTESGNSYHWYYNNGTLIQTLTTTSDNQQLNFSVGYLLPAGIYYLSETEVSVPTPTPTETETPPPSGGSSSGTGTTGVGTSDEPLYNIECRETGRIRNLQAGTETYYRTTKPDCTDIIKVTFTPTQNSGEQPILIEKLHNKSRFVTEEAPHLPYSYFNLYVGLFGFDEKTTNEKILFKVSKDWATTNNVTPESVTLYIFEPSTTSWKSLPTTLSHTDTLYYVYESESGATYGRFAIVGTDKVSLNIIEIITEKIEDIIPSVNISESKFIIGATSLYNNLKESILNLLPSDISFDTLYNIFDNENASTYIMPILTIILIVAISYFYNYEHGLIAGLIAIILMILVTILQDTTLIKVMSVEAGNIIISTIAYTTIAFIISYILGEKLK